MNGVEAYCTAERLFFGQLRAAELLSFAQSSVASNHREDHGCGNITPLVLWFLTRDNHTHIVFIARVTVKIFQCKVIVLIVRASLPYQRSIALPVMPRCETTSCVVAFGNMGYKEMGGTSLVLVAC